MNPLNSLSMSGQRPATEREGEGEGERDRETDRDRESERCVCVFERERVVGGTIEATARRRKGRARRMNPSSMSGRRPATERARERYRGTSLVRECTSQGPYRRPVPRDLW